MFTGDIVAGIGFKNTNTGDTPLRPGRRDRAREPRVPRAGHPRRRRAQDQGRPGQDGQGALRAVRGGPDLPGPHRRGDRPDRHLRHGRAAPRGARRPHAPRVQGRRHRRQAAGRLPRDDHPAGRQGHLHATRSRPAARASTPRSPSTSSPPAPAAATSSSTRSPAAASPRSTSRRSTPASSSRSTPACSPGYPTVDVRATLTDGKYHDVDSSEMAFKIAGSMAFKEAARKAKPVLLEPIMSVEVVTPEDYMGDVIGDLNVPPGPGRRHGAARQQPGGPGPRARCRRCSATLPTCVRAPRVAPPTRCSSTATSRRPHPSGRDRRPGPRRVADSPTSTTSRVKRSKQSWPRRSSSGTSRM